MCLSDIIAYYVRWNLAHHFFAYWYNLDDLLWCEVFFSSLSQHFLWETCCKNYTYNDEIFFRKIVKFCLSKIIWNLIALKCQCLKHTLKFLDNNFCLSNTSWREISFLGLDLGSWRPWLFLQYNFYTNLLRTIISSLVNKKYYIILLCYSCFMFSCLPLRVLYFPCYIEVSLDPKLERSFFNYPRFSKAYYFGLTNVIYS